MKRLLPFLLCFLTMMGWGSTLSSVLLLKQGPATPGLTKTQASKLYNGIVPRRRIIGWFPSWSNGMSLYTSNGTSDYSGYGKVGLLPFTTCTKTSWLWINGSTIGATGLLTPVGNSIAVKAGLLTNGNYMPLSFNSATTAPLTTPVITANNVTTTAPSVASTTVTAPTANFVVGDVCLDTTNSTTFTVSSITNSSAMVVYPAVTLGSGDTIEVTSYPGNPVIISDMQYVVSNPIDITLPASTTYYLGNYYQVGAGQKWPFTYYCGTYASFLGSTSYRSSGTVYGSSPTTNGSDYTWSGNPTLGTTSGMGYQFGPTVGFCTQIIPKAVCLLEGDSISFGYGNNVGGGYLGTALNAAGIGFFDEGVSGSTSVNLNRFNWLGNLLAGYVDHVLCHVGINDLPGGNSITNTEAAWVGLAQSATAKGADFTACAMYPRVSVTSGSLGTLAGQTPLTTEASRIQENNYLRDTSANGFHVAAVAACAPGAVILPIIDPASVVETNLTGGIVSLNQTTYAFTTSSANATYTATYVDSASHVFTTGPTISGGTTLYTTCSATSGVPLTGTLTKTSGIGDSTITYTAYTQSSNNQQGFGTGGYWPLSNGGTTGGTTYWASVDGIHPGLNLNTTVGALVNAATYSALNNAVFGY